jgi:hypothetical protein
MINVTITNASASAIGAGTDTPLPAPFDWATIAASGSKAFAVQESELSTPSVGGGQSPNERLAALRNRGVISFTVAEVAGETDPASKAREQAVGFGLGRDSSGRLEVTATADDVGDGLVSTEGVISANLTDGLGFDSSTPKKVKLQLGDGLAFDASSPKKAKVGIGNGLEFDASTPKLVQAKAVSGGGLGVASGGISITGFVENTPFSTTDATQGTAMTYAMPGAAGVKAFDLLVVAKYEDGSNGAVYKILGLAKTNGSAATMIGAPDVRQVEGDAALAATVDTDSNNLRVRVTGKAATNMSWFVFGQVR